MLETYEKLLKQVDNRARFLSAVFSGDIQCINRKKNELRQEFMEKGFDPLPEEGQPAAMGATGVKEVNGKTTDLDTSGYDYLFQMSVSSLNEEYLEHLLELKRRFKIKIGVLRKAAPQYLKSQKEPHLLDTNYKKPQPDRDVTVDMAAKDRQISEAAPRRQHKRSAAESLEESAVLMDDDGEEPPELKDQSQEHTETEGSQRQETKKRRKRRKKQRKESGAPIHCCRQLDFRCHDKSGDGLLVKEIKGIASGLDGIKLTHCNRDQNSVANEMAKLSLRGASVRHEGVIEISVKPEAS